MNQVMIVAGEASGDLHGANLVRAVGSAAPDVSFFGLGGKKLEAAGVRLLFDLEHMSLMGITEVFSGVGKFLSIYRSLKEAMIRERPRALVLIDYPELNLALAKTAKAAGIPVFYYICPQVWAWRTWRVKKLGRFVDRRIVVFPFEVDFYKKHGLHADFLGHPLLDMMDAPRPRPEVRTELGLETDRPHLLLMPGSRAHLVKTLLPIMMKAVHLIRRDIPNLQVLLARADTLDSDLIGSLTKGHDLKIISGKSHLLQNAADAVLVASGTSTLETALMVTPMVVIYKTTPLSYFLGRHLINTKVVSIPNLIAEKEVVPELLQYDVTPGKIAAHLRRILVAGREREEMISGLARVREKLGQAGAARRAAELLIDTIGVRSLKESV